MANYINTKTQIGETAALDGLVGHTLTSFTDTDVTSLGQYALSNNTALTEVNLPSVKTAGNYFMSGCTGVTTITEDNFPALTTIPQYAFQNCTGMMSYTSNAATRISDSAFIGCTGLTTAHFGSSSAVAFNNKPFTSCPNLNALIIDSTTMSTLESGGLSGTKIDMGEGAVYVPTSLVSTYKANSNWAPYFIADSADYPLSDFSTISDNLSTIVGYANAGTIGDHYSVGDTKLITLTDDTQWYIQIVGIDADPLATGSGYANSSWMFKRIYTTHKMNSTATTSGGWPNSAMRSWLRSDFLTLLPSEIQNNIKTVTKTYVSYDSGSAVTESVSDTIWIPSALEVLGGSSSESSGPAYTTVFNSRTARIKYNQSSTADFWWLRSASSATYCRYVSNTGSTNTSIANNTYGVVPGFCL